MCSCQGKVRTQDDAGKGGKPASSVRLPAPSAREDVREFADRGRPLTALHDTKRHGHLDGSFGPWEHVFAMGESGSPYARFRRAIERRQATAALSAAAELQHVALTDALELVLLLRDRDPARAYGGRRCEPRRLFRTCGNWTRPRCARLLEPRLRPLARDSGVRITRVVNVAREGKAPARDRLVPGGHSLGEK